AVRATSFYRDAVQEVLDSTTLEDLVRYEEENHGGYMFYI
ncbi:hypothetical protein ACT4UL_15760, partial [Bacillus sp. HC-TM]